VRVVKPGGRETSLGCRCRRGRHWPWLTNASVPGRVRIRSSTA
jgi:hypothetical protein